MGQSKLRNRKYSRSSYGEGSHQSRFDESELDFVEFLEDEDLQMSDPTDSDGRYSLSDDLKKELIEWVHTHHP